MCFEHIRPLPLFLLTPPRSTVSIPPNFGSSLLNFNLIGCMCDPLIPTGTAHTLMVVGLYSLKCGISFLGMLFVLKWYIRIHCFDSSDWTLQHGPAASLKFLGWPSSVGKPWFPLWLVFELRGSNFRAIRKLSASPLEESKMGNLSWYLEGLLYCLFYI